MPRMRLYCFDGTWANRNTKSKSTLLAFILDYISKGIDLEIKYFSGVGARNGLIERYIGGGLATREVTSTIIDAISDLATNYRSGDEIVVLGYSRGSYTGRSFIGFLDRVGLPIDGDRHILHHLYNKYTSGQFLKRDVASHLRRKYNCVHVEIKTRALCSSPILAQEISTSPPAFYSTITTYCSICLLEVAKVLCIDTVGALGIPHTGIFGLLDLLPPLIRKQQFMEANAASNVQVLLHALALHESRGPFQPTLMQIEGASSQTLKQVWFLGSHGDVANGDERGSIGDIVLAWCVANLETHAGIAFDEAKLSVRFPRMGANLPMSNGLVWVHDDIRDPVKGLWRPMGRSIRVPNKQVAHGKRTNESVHETARFRGYGSSRGRSVVPGHSVELQGNSFVWKRDKSQPSESGANTATLREAVISHREAELLGISITPAMH